MRKCTFAAMAESLCRCVCLLIILSLITSFCHGTSCNDIGCAQLNFPGSNNISCQEFNKTECSKYNTSEGNKSHTADNVTQPALLSAIRVSPQNASRSAASKPGTSTLSVSWQITPDKIKLADGYFIRLHSADMDKCVAYGFSEALAALNSSQEFSYDCFTGLEANQTYVIDISSLPALQTTEYLLQLPPTINQVWDPGTSSGWVTPIAVAALSAHQIHAVFSLAPGAFNFTYFIRLDRQTSDGHTQPGANFSLTQNQTQYTFEDISSGKFVVVIQPWGIICGDNCSQSKSHPITLTGHTTFPLSTTKAGPSYHSVTSTSTVSTPTTTTTDSSVIVKPSENHDYKRNLAIILGTVFGFCGCVVAIVVTVCIYKRHAMRSTGNSRMQRFDDNFDGHVSISLDHAFVSQPAVLLLYSYDCPVHEKVVNAFALYLKQVFGCDVIFDIWQQSEIQEKGTYEWLEEKMVTAQFVLFVCSTGARYKCARNKKFSLKNDRSMADMFPSAVASAAESMRIARYSGEVMHKFIVVYFDYSTESDIPHKLDRGCKYSLVTELFPLYCHLHEIKPEMCDSCFLSRGVTFETVLQIQEGVELINCIDEATEYFRLNPDWLGERLEPVRYPSPKKVPVVDQQKHQERTVDSDIQFTDTPEEGSVNEGSITSVDSGLLNINNEKQLLLDSHGKKKRRSRHRKRTNQGYKPGSPDALSTSSQQFSPNTNHSTNNNSSSTLNQTMNMSQPKANGSKYVYKNESLGLLEDEELEDDNQLRRDIEFIQKIDHLRNQSKAQCILSHLPANEQEFSTLKSTTCNHRQNGAVKTMEGSPSSNDSVQSLMFSSNHSHDNHHMNSVPISQSERGRHHDYSDANGSLSNQNSELIFKPLDEALSKQVNMPCSTMFTDV